MAERGIATVGLIVGGLAAAVGIVAVGTGGISLPWAGAIFSGGILTTVGFSLTRHGVLSREAGTTLAALGSVLLLGSAVMILLDSPAGAVPYGIIAGIVGLAVLGLAIADISGTNPRSIASGIRAISVSVVLMLTGFIAAAMLLAIPELLPLNLTTVAASAYEQLALGIGFVVVTLGFLIVSGRQLGYLDIQWPDRRAMVWMATGIVLVIGSALGLGLIYSLLGIEGAEHELYDRAREDAFILLVGMPLTLVATAVGEEVLYRNGIQKYLTERFAPAIAVVVTSILFAVAHLSALVAAGATGLVATLSVIFVLSIIIGTIYEHIRNVLVPIAIHGSYNVFVFALWYLDLAG